uniref:TIL domain-containing protein n=1 Tax=Steinernema glaseri TaxID=37863 RepID=A0A1I7ZE07_9BILA
MAANQDATALPFWDWSETLTGTVSSGESASTDEEWSECPGCEATCDDPNPVCTKECKPARCMCKKGLVRDASNGVCMEPKECVQHESCGEHAHWSRVPPGLCISSCPLTCSHLNGAPRICTMGCRYSICYCDRGYIRGGPNGSCIPYVDCPQENFRLN